MKLIYLLTLIVSISFLGCTAVIKTTNPTGRTVNIIQNNKLIKAVIVNDKLTIDKQLNSKNVNSFYITGLFDMITNTGKAIYSTAKGDIGTLIKIDGESNDKFTLIIIASKYGYYDTVIKLLKYGASANSWSVGPYETKLYTNAITEAYFNGHLKIVELLLLNGANPHKNAEKYNKSVSDTIFAKKHSSSLNKQEQKIYNLIKKYK